ncbi:bacteriorhodopsin [Halorussus sp. AFM4]|uniref:bacteriorhodopsin n=1 Tax=Halorussus sp. AFM4 TaxID=3421651 RepID=UPI003EBD6A4B
MSAATSWFWIGAIGMAAGTVAPAWRLATERRHRAHYAVLALITGIATVAYATMALGIGGIDVGGTVLYLPRYVDWLLTTPLLVLYLGLLCRPSRRVYAALVAVDVFVMGSGVVAGLLDGTAKYAMYLAGSVAYLGLLWLLLRTLPRAATGYSDRVDAVFTKLRNLTVVLWTLYPVVWILSPLGLGLLDVGTEVLVVTYLDLISKVGFVVIAVNGRDALDSLADDAAVPVERSAAD